MYGPAATRATKRELPGTSVLVMTMHENPDYLLQALQACAAGYVLKDAAQDEVLSAVGGARRRIPLAPKLAARLLRRLAAEVREPANGLQPRKGTRRCSNR